jgi:hypothetical protein
MEQSGSMQQEEQLLLPESPLILQPEFAGNGLITVSTLPEI